MEVIPLELPQIKLIRPKRHGDHRGFFSEVYSRRDLAAAGLDLDFVQDNHSRSAEAGTIRALHFQTAPFAQDKLVRVARGRILDVAVDVRRGSATFGRHVAVELSADNWSQLFVPKGFAHGLCTLEPDTEVLYKVTEYFAPANDAGILWCDPDLGIDWPVSPDRAILSAKDRTLPRLKDAPMLF